MRHNMCYVYSIMAVICTWMILSTSTFCYWEGYGEDNLHNTKYACRHVGLPFIELPERETDANLNVRIIDSNLPVIDSTQFLDISHVCNLALVDNNIKTILPGAFVGQSSLKTLSLHQNELTNLSQGLFNSMIDLSGLDISNNDIKYIDPNFLVGIMNLQYLDLSHNSLEYFNDTFLGRNYNLDKIDLSYNRISEIILNNPKFNINSLDISYNLLTETKIIHISGLTSLKYLNIAGNEISSVSSNLFTNFKQLVYLNLSHNKLKTLSYGMFDNMKVLQILDISCNNLTSLIRYLHSLATLNTLDVSNNNLRSLDSKQILRDIPNLRRINLNLNNFACTELIKVIRDLKNRLAKGNNEIGSNIQGISCDDYEFGMKDDASKFEDLISTLEDAISSKLEKYEGHEFERSYKYSESVDSRNSIETSLVKFFNDVKSEYFNKYPVNKANYFIILSLIVILLMILVAIKIISFYRNCNQPTIIGTEPVELIGSLQNV